ncbi:MAG: sugar transferase [Flavobacteriales bacterium]|nr:sugar transferase [Flavobacteriales bacterium]
MTKRLFDIVFSILGMAFLFPLFLVLGVFLVLDSGFPIIYRQKRVGLNNIDFTLFKLRSMSSAADTKGFLTVGNDDIRITPFGKILRRFKLDELPQLINVFNGTMSFVGPRPEVRKYVDLYSTDQLYVLTVKPGITDVASIVFINENELLKEAVDPDREYINKIMPTKLAYNLEYISEQSFFYDIVLILKTIGKIFR